MTNKEGEGEEKVALEPRTEYDQVWDRNILMAKRRWSACPPVGPWRAGW